MHRVPLSKTQPQVKKLENRNDIKVAKKALIKIKKEKPISWKEAKKDLGL